MVSYFISLDLNRLACFISFRLSRHLNDHLNRKNPFLIVAGFLFIIFYKIFDLMCIYTKIYFLQIMQKDKIFSLFIYEKLIS